ncbi:MAG TPA: HAMP domain-containing histidine kinase [Firmicutes bacterium]|nr:HAMP domain-containing histidine kinase [Bacillota bacterium]
MEKLRAYRLRRRIAVPLMLAFSVLWLGTMALLTASTQDRLDITVQRIYKDARDDLEEQWSYYEANLENGLGAEAEHIMVDNLSSSSLAFTDIAEGGMAFVTRDEENHVIQSQLAWGYGHEADVDMGQRWHLRFDNGLDDAGQLELAQWIMEHRLQHWSYTLYPPDGWFAEDAAKDPNCDGRYARITGIELPGYAIEVQKVEIVHPDGTIETMVETTTPGEPTITLDLHYVKISSVLLPGLSYSGGELENSPVDMQLRLKNFRETQAIVSRELADEDRVVQTRGGEITGMSNGSSGTMRMVAGQCSTLTAAIEEEQFLYISTFLLTAAVVLLLSGHLSRKVTSPVEELSQQAAAGHCRVDGPITELNALAVSFNRAQDQLAGQLRREREFTRAAAHELKTPLAVLRTHAEALREDILPEKREQYLGIVLEECDRMAELVGRLLEFSRLESGAALHREPLEFAGLIREVLEPLELQLEQKQIRLTADLPELPLTGDRERLREVVGNLLSNALRHCPTGGEIRLALTREAGWACLSVRNDGLPIPAEDLPHLWEPFFRGDRSRSRKSGGTGLGLAIVQAAVTAHGGSCSVENLGQGVCFRIRLPLDPDSTSGTANTSEHA